MTGDTNRREEEPAVTIRRSTDEERRAKFPPPFGGTKPAKVPRYVVVNPITDRIWTVFGLPQGGSTRAEAVFWAERLASKNGLRYVPPVGWGNVIGTLS